MQQGAVSFICLRADGSFESSIEVAGFSHLKGPPGTTSTHQVPASDASGSKSSLPISNGACGKRDLCVLLSRKSSGSHPDRCTSSPVSSEIQVLLSILSTILSMWFSPLSLQMMAAPWRDLHCTWEEKREESKGLFSNEALLCSWKGNPYPKISTRIFCTIIVTCLVGLQGGLEREMF